jgi:hypothetical protein
MLLFANKSNMRMLLVPPPNLEDTLDISLLIQVSYPNLVGILNNY